MSAPPIAGLLETALYVDDMARSAGFFRDVIGLTVMLETGRLTAFDAGHGGVLLVFARGESTADMVSDRGTVAGHDGRGPLHMAFAIAEQDYDAWRAHLTAADVPLRGEMRWPAGGRSLYFEDPDGHVLEVATPGLWANDGDRP
ncbi:VOC family protein [Sphingomonas sp. SUN019]|uniref:VOC family protein n=1 Tax=Sphingomonas sp. SUN019 TaxID=2937788 RepID=UPI00216449A6|nr:VOC family protein [Sphingomonas sp. SUN019]UVO51441.1 VOC family protein [Sphingomonas sp. SUN019]